MDDKLGSKEVTTETCTDIITDKNDKNDKNDITCLKVKADPPDITPEERKRNVKNLAGAISHALRNKGEIPIRAFGAAAVSKAVKALAIATTYLKVQKIKLDCSVGFITTKVGENHDEELTGLCFIAFASEMPEGYVEIDVNTEENRKKSLMVKADPKDIGSEDRKSALHKLAGAISHALEENKDVVIIRAFGSASIHKASKALGVSRTHVSGRGYDLYFYPVFIMTDMSGQERTGIAWVARTNES